LALVGEQVGEGGMAMGDKPVDRLPCSALGSRVLRLDPFGEDRPDVVAGAGDEPGVGRCVDEQRQACDCLIRTGGAVGGGACLANATSGESAPS
jgi:hypothetical protein